MEILYVAHCVPWPPDKGDRIRAFNSIRQLAKRHRVHVACFTLNARDAEAVSELQHHLASLRIEVLTLSACFLRGLLGLARGGSFTTEFHRSPALLAHMRSVLATGRIGAVVLLSSSSSAYAPEGVPFLADWGDVDSEKRLQYAKMRRPGFPHWLEGHRLRRVERDMARKASCTFMTTETELQLFHQIAPGAVSACCGNGVDTEYFDPQRRYDLPAELVGRKYVAFVGVLNYFPNTDGICWFAKEIFPELRARDPELELVLVGRNPSQEVMQLAKQPAITVTGEVPDVRPYVAGARAVVAPLRIARGIQNKVLEALAMGKRVLASEAVCQTFVPHQPVGLIPCISSEDYVRAAADLPAASEPDPEIVGASRARFSWSAALEPILTELDRLEQGAAVRQPSCA
jgi:sugar transferase (PEP-CTERM/EpsH1 system associated)